MAQQAKDVLDAMATRLDDAPDMMKGRRCTVEHPFATIKAWMGDVLANESSAPAQYGDEFICVGLQYETRYQHHGDTTVNRLQCRHKPVLQLINSQMNDSQ